MFLKAEFSHELPIANSSILHFPRLLIQASLSLVITVALYGGTNFSSIFDDPVVGTPFSQNISFTPKGIPARLFVEVLNPFSLKLLKAQSFSSRFLLLSLK